MKDMGEVARVDGDTVTINPAAMEPSVVYYYTVKGQKYGAVKLSSEKLLILELSADSKE